jgi:GDP-L-fucose synthase
MYGGDLAAVIKACIENDINESFNVATDDNLSIRQIAEIALKACGLENFELKFDNSSPDGQFRKDVSNKKMREHFPDFKFTPLDEGIKKVHTFYKEHNIIL